jgi:copper homeostasis protein
MTRQLEIVCTSLRDAVDAQHGGANRIELCARLSVGGLTPSTTLLRKVKSTVQIPVFVLIRPRGGDFCYTATEFTRLLRQIAAAKAHGADGIVCGALFPNGHLDVERTAQMVAAAHPLPFTFHRAFDRCLDPLAAIDRLAELGVERILTSGQCPTALEGIGNLKAYAKYAAGRLTILVGGGVRPGNLEALMQVDGLREFHSSGRDGKGRSIRKAVRAMAGAL